MREEALAKNKEAHRATKRRDDHVTDQHLCLILIISKMYRITISFYAFSFIYFVFLL
jgi:hypothetical protein